MPDTRSGDWGGVHINSGIPNKAFYLACKSLGRAHSWEKAGRIWYDALCNRLGAMSQFKDAKDATVAAALALFDQAAANAVGDAWKAVGM
jgi:bacillolysin